MQRRYFDLVSTNLQPVADALDALYGGYEAKEKVLPFKA